MKKKFAFYSWLLVLSAFCSSCNLETRLAIAEKQWRHERYTSALKSYNVLSKKYSDVRIVEGKAMVYMLQHRVDSAILLFSTAIRNNSSNPYNFFYLTTAFLEKSDTVSALKTLSETYSINGYDTLRNSKKVLGLLKSLNGQQAYEFWKAGKRLVQINFTESYSKETDKLTENDQFIMLISDSSLLFCSDVITDKDLVYWKDASVTYLCNVKSPVRILLCDADYLYHDILLDYKGEWPMSDTVIRNKNSYLKLLVSDGSGFVKTHSPAPPKAVNDFNWLQSLGVK